ncbi:beta-galactosidase [Salipaludibacillus aurantiacus]|uniref:Beta-galactosidase n=1 Tax=Salipaludibacillus aurantiacus TaxID=1601833 RepID=A0A1H9RVR0_9BACI|nr:beta-galactosidase [Salipaludibacillus aurantiacus]SER76243.1 beta-galactosidase [Salipaludibacillus aurantiacus]
MTEPVVFPPLNEKAPGLLHGADYNPEQWKDYPHIFEEDLKLMKKAKCNVMSVGIFSWVSLEPEEGRFTFEWMDEVLDRLYKNGVFVFLATPSGARPAWLSQKYPEVLRVTERRMRNLHGFRHNHCYTSPKYREKVSIINTELAERYSQHPAVIGWHISNEYGGECHCDYCQDAFRAWLETKYKSLDKLNHDWWTSFWSHTYTDWSQIESPSPVGENMVHGLNLDWKRFVTDQTVDFLKHEVKPLREKNPKIPVTTNFMGDYEGLNYWKFTEILDIISWDAYPDWHVPRDGSKLAARVGLLHDLNRSFKGGQPFMLMESTPSMTNWQSYSKLKRPGMHLLSSIQAIAHGSDTVQYFQWRKSRGSSEKFHGAVVGHDGTDKTRVFKEVQKTGETLEKLYEISGTSVQPEAAIIYDWENRWALKDAQGPRNIGMHYEETVEEHYRPFWEKGIPADIVDMEADFSRYKLVIAPMLYMIRAGAAEKLEQFVKDGGTLVTTYWSGIVNESDLCFLGGFPGPLKNVLGIYSEEIDSLVDGETNAVDFKTPNHLGLTGSYTAKELCDLIHLETAEALAAYSNDFYAGTPALTVNQFGKGKAYYVASRNCSIFQLDFLSAVISETSLKPVLNADLPAGVSAQKRTNGQEEFIFLMNFNESEVYIELCRDNNGLTDMLSGKMSEERILLEPYGFKVFRKGLS